MYVYCYFNVSKIYYLVTLNILMVVNTVMVNISKCMYVQYSKEAFILMFIYNENNSKLQNLCSLQR